MKIIYQLTKEEYEELTKKQKEPSVLLQQTVDNFKAKNQQLCDKITLLESELSTYKLGGAKPRSFFQSDRQQLVDIVRTYNAALSPQVKPSIQYAAEQLDLDFYFIKQRLKNAVRENIIEREKNTYIFKD